jgi:hypothetical protein
MVPCPSFMHAIGARRTKDAGPRTDQGQGTKD